MRLEVGLQRRHFVLAAARAFQIVHGIAINREETHGGAVFGCHVGNGGAVGQRQRLDSLAIKLDKLAHHFSLAQHFGHGQHQVGRGHTFAQATFHVKADNIRGQEIDGLTEHTRFGLNTAHAPTDNTNTVNHGGMGVSTYQRIKINYTVFIFVHTTRQIF